MVEPHIYPTLGSAAQIYNVLILRNCLVVFFVAVFKFLHSVSLLAWQRPICSCARLDILLSVSPSIEATYAEYWKVYSCLLTGRTAQALLQLLVKLRQALMCALWNACNL